MVNLDEKKKLEQQAQNIEENYTYENIPDELLLEISKNLPDKDLVNFSLTNKYQFNLFERPLGCRKLLKHVVRGEQDDAKHMITKHPELLTMRGKVTDYSSRNFENITPFEYTLWALDRHMWTMMLDALPNDKKGSGIRNDLFRQYQKLSGKDGGVQFTLNNKTHKEQHYNFSLKDELYNIGEGLKTGWTNEQLSKYWIEKVGGAQKMVPVHVANEYCAPGQKFNENTELNKDELPRKLDIYDREDEKLKETWFSKDSSPNDLGSKYAVIGVESKKAFMLVPNTAFDILAIVAIPQDLVAIKKLCTVRKDEFKNLGSELQDALKESTTNSSLNIC